MEDKLKKEMIQLQNTFRKNGYPRQVIRNNLRKTRKTGEGSSTKTGNEDDKTEQPNLFLPYIQGVSEKIQVACRKLNISSNQVIH